MSSKPHKPHAHPRSAYRVWRRISTRWMDNDAYGHVNNVVYYSWFDTAVNAYLIEQGALDVANGATVGLVVLIVVAAVLLCGMTEIPQQDFWRQALLRPLAETAARSVMPYLPSGLATKIQL